MKLREYQERTIRELPTLLRKHKRVLLVAPTGSGKTVMAAAFILKRPGSRVVWLAHRIELIRQAVKELVAAGIPEADIGVVSGTRMANDPMAEHYANQDARVLVASVDMFRSGRSLPKSDLVVIDEAHRARSNTYMALLSECEAEVLGLTATPKRLDGKALGDAFSHLLNVATNTELIADGYIAQPVSYGIPKEKAISMVKGLRVGKGDWSQKQLGEIMMVKAIVGSVVDEWERLARGIQTIVFATNRKHGRTLLEAFLARGHAVEYLDGDTPAAEREAITKRLESGETTVVVNVDVYSEGFDCPPVKCVVLARPTRSESRYLQQTGRVVRPLGSRRPLVLDHAGNVWRHGLPETDRDWSLEGREPTRTGEAPVKQCTECPVMMPVGCHTCPNCGAEQPKSEEEEQAERIRLERIRAEEKERERKRKILEKLADLRGLDGEWVERAMEEVA